ncbi:pilin [Variovorax atrisoli]|uniref:pilin n=1 Tax=Variovorax atrisoli TaxID=3394203 RepID=UPI00403FCF64
MNRRTIARRAQAGFTLIELMIVVAIIGILAAIAIPQYQTYVAKSQVSRVVSETGSQKTAIEDCVLNGKTSVTAGDTQCKGTATGSNLLAAGTGNTVDGAAPADAKLGAPVLAFQDGGAATLTSTFGGSAAAALATKTVTWTRDTSGTWTCKTTVDDKYTTSACPKAAAAG